MCSKIGADMVDLYVGPEEEHFRVHKEKLCSRIPYFEKMFNGQFKKASDNIAKFPEDNAAAFDVLMEWVYSYDIRHIRDLVDEGTDDESDPSWDAVEFYSLAEKFCLPSLQDTIMNVIVRFHKSWDELPSPDFVDRAYSRTSAGSPLSKYCARAIYYIMDNGIEDGWPTEALQKLFQEHPTFSFDYITLQRGDSAYHPATATRCTFHVHGEGEPCVDDNGKKRRYAQGKTGPAKSGVKAPMYDLRCSSKTHISRSRPRRSKQNLWKCSLGHY